MCKTALVTPNVFHNVLLGEDLDCELYRTMLERLLSRSIQWYMTKPDYYWAFFFWDLFSSRLDRQLQDRYFDFRSSVRVCQVTPTVLEEVTQHRLLNFADALRLSCAIDRNLDAIVTWEPHHFTRTRAESEFLQRSGYFILKIESEEIDSQQSSFLETGIFSPSSLLTYLYRFHSPPSHRRQYFTVDKIQISGGDEDSATTAWIALRDWEGRRLEATASGMSPLAALQTAIDFCVDNAVRLPKREIYSMVCPAKLMCHADAPVEAIVRVRSGGIPFEASATNSSILRAASEAYIETINSMCNCPHLDG